MVMKRKTKMAKLRNSRFRKKEGREKQGITRHKKLKESKKGPDPKEDNSKKKATGGKRQKAK